MWFRKVWWHSYPSLQICCYTGRTYYLEFPQLPGWYHLLDSVALHFLENKLQWHSMCLEGVLNQYICKANPKWREVKLFLGHINGWHTIVSYLRNFSGTLHQNILGCMQYNRVRHWLNWRKKRQFIRVWVFCCGIYSLSVSFLSIPAAKCNICWLFVTFTVDIDILKSVFNLLAADIGSLIVIVVTIIMLGLPSTFGLHAVIPTAN